MPTTSELHVVLGASGGTGGAVVRELARRGHRVRAVSRRGNADAPAGVERLAADVATACAADTGAKLVLADNLYAYGPHEGTLTEDLPAAASGRKGRVRALMAERLLAAHRQGRLRVAIGRSSDYYGPGGLNS